MPVSSLLVRWLPILALGVACAAPSAQPQASSPAQPASVAPSMPKRVSLAVAANVPTLIDRMSAGGVGVPGLGDLQKMMSPGLTVRDDKGALRPILASTAPTLENGLWAILPDGRMQTTWKINPAARWHDDAPFTSDDVIFTSWVDRDQDVPMRRSLAYASVDEIAAPDAGTVIVTWKQPYIQADMLYDDPLFPKHLIEATYLEDKPSFPQITYWTDDFVGTGAYRLKEYVRGSHLVLQASDAFVLGRPRIDEVEVKFIPDSSTLMANVLAGA